MVFINESGHVDPNARVGGDRKLRAGVDYPLWSKMKWAHAGRLAQQLMSSIQVHRISMGVETTAELSDDGLEATFFAHIPHVPPTYEWSLLLGDVLHNYRSSLDSLAWSMAHLDGARPDPLIERRIAFPFALDRTTFERLARTNLASVPGFVLERMEAVQPYYNPGTTPIGTLLHELDIEDKHRSTVEIELRARYPAPYSVKYSFVEHVPEPEHDAEELWSAPNGPIHHGDKVVAWRFAAPVATAEIDTLPLEAMVSSGTNEYSVRQLLEQVDRQMYATFAIIEDGHIPVEALDWLRS